MEGFQVAICQAHLQLLYQQTDPIELSNNLDLSAT
jgi:hypothetical protein